MLIHPWDAAVSADEWRAWLSGGRDFGQLVAGAADWPVIVPTHFVLDGDVVLVHLARPNPIWKAIESTGTAVLSVVDEYAYIPSYWRVDGPVSPPPEAVPTSYYSSVQLRCRVELVDEAEAKAELLAAQLRHFQPEGEIVAPSADGPHARFLAGIRGVKLHVVEARAKFKYDDQKPAGLQSSVNAHLHDRSSGHDLAVAEQQARRMAARGVGP